MHMLTTVLIMTVMFSFIMRNAIVNVHKQSPNMGARWAHTKTMPPSRCVQVSCFFCRGHVVNHVVGKKHYFETVSRAFPIKNVQILTHNKSQCLWIERTLTQFYLCCKTRHQSSTSPIWPKICHHWPIQLQISRSRNPQQQITTCVKLVGDSYHSLSLEQIRPTSVLHVCYCLPAFVIDRRLSFPI